MPETREDNYDNFKIMLREIRRFNDEYHSFTTDRTYTNLLGETASGLLKDVAKDTMELSPEDREKHQYSKEVFAAFCMYFCVTQIMGRYDKVADMNLAGDTVASVYERILKRIKRDLNANGECPYVRYLICCSADNVMKDLLKKEGKFIGIADESFDDESDEVSNRIRITLVDKACEAMKKYKKLTALDRVLSKAYKRNILSKDEYFSICSFFGLGDGFEKLSNHEIAQKFKCSDGMATKMRQAAFRKLYDFIENSPEFREIFF